MHQGESSNLTLLGQVWVPTGSSPAGSDSVDPVLVLLYDQMLDDRLQFFCNVLAARYEDGGSDYNQKQFTLGLGYGLGPRWGSYIEYFAAYPGIDAVDETSLVDGGFTYNPTPDMQIDISVGVGLRESSSDFVSIGFSFRY